MCWHIRFFWLSSLCIVVVARQQNDGFCCCFYFWRCFAFFLTEIIKYLSLSAVATAAVTCSDSSYLPRKQSKTPIQNPFRLHHTQTTTC